MCSLLVKNIYIYFCIHYEFPSILILSSVKSAFTFSTIDSYIMTLQVLSGCLTIFTIHVEFWKQAQKSLQSQQVKCLFWGFYWQPSSLNWECLHHILTISLIVVMHDGFNHPGHHVSGESVQILHHPTKKVWMSKDRLLTLHPHSKYAQKKDMNQTNS